MKKLREMKKNNKGFSLVELIVVIAIMVVLVAVLGSTILGYIDEAKYSKDIQALDSIDTVMMLLVTDPNANLASVSGATPGTLQDLYGASAAEGKTTCSNASIIENTLSETFKVNKDDKGNKTLTFNGESDAFKGLTGAQVFIHYVDGQVKIHVDAKGDESTYPDYQSPASGTGLDKTVGDRS